jgi:hypothetical protein
LYARRPPARPSPAYLEEEVVHAAALKQAVRVVEPPFVSFLG